MSNISKFYTDAQRIIKHDRADNAGNYDGMRASTAVAKFFEQITTGLAELPQSITNYWLTTYIKSSQNIQNEPTENHLDWLAKVLALLEGEFESDMDFSTTDWKELASMTNCESEDLPIDVLSDLMSIFVSHNLI
jgi:hypothetical protein